MVQPADAMEAGRSDQVAEGASSTRMIEQATLGRRQDEGEIVVTILRRMAFRYCSQVGTRRPAQWKMRRLVRRSPKRATSFSTVIRERGTRESFISEHSTKRRGAGHLQRRL